MIFPPIACAPAQADVLPPDLILWLEQHAEAMDRGTLDPAQVLPVLAQAGVFRWGVTPRLGGIPDSTIAQAIDLIARIASHSLTAAFVAWSQRSFIEFLQLSPNVALAEQWIPDLVAGRIAGAAGLSNAMKFLCGIEPLQISAVQNGAFWLLNGVMPWVTNLRPQGYLVAAAVSAPNGSLAVACLAHDLPGMQRSADLSLLGLQGSNTAAIRLEQVRMAPAMLIHTDARNYLPRARPSFVGLQCGFSVGLSRRCLTQARQAIAVHTARHILSASLEELETQIEDLALELQNKVQSGRFIEHPAELFELRIALAEHTAQAIQLELQASGGSAYLTGQQPSFARRWREAAFLPIVTPSLVQLKTELAKQRAMQAAQEQA